MPGQIGILGGLSLADHSSKDSRGMIVTSGFYSGTFEKKRIFSTGSVSIGRFRINPARIMWDTGSKQTFVYVPSLEMIGIEAAGSFPVSGIGAEVDAFVYPARFDLGGGISISNIYVGALEIFETVEEGGFDSTDVILGMEVITLGSLRISGQDGKWSFKIS